MRLPSSQPVPRVPRSRRDARFVMSHPLPPKRGGVGIVTSREGDTCSVLITGEVITGCIPLTSMPPVDAIVEVESRGDIMVVLDWTAGEPAQPKLGGWYFDPVESPGWLEGDDDSPVGVGERVTHPAPSAPGLLWNTTEIRVRPGDKLTFSMLLSWLDPAVAVTAQMVLCVAEYGQDPSPSNGEVISYGSPLLVDGLAEEFKVTAVVPADFDKPPGGGSRAPSGSARVGIRFEAAP